MVKLGQIIHDGFMAWNNWENYRIVLPSGAEIETRGYDDDLLNSEKVEIIINQVKDDIIISYTLGINDDCNKVIKEEVCNKKLAKELVDYLENKRYNG